MKLGPQVQTDAIPIFGNIPLNSKMWHNILFDNYQQVFS